MLPLKFLQILFLLGFSQQAQVPPQIPSQAPAMPSAFRISGRVVDAISGQPLARASVTMNVSASPGAPAPLDSGPVEVTDQEGGFAFARFSACKYFFFAPPPHYFPHTNQHP